MCFLQIWEKHKPDYRGSPNIAPISFDMNKLEVAKTNHYWNLKRFRRVTVFETTLMPANRHLPDILQPFVKSRSGHTPPDHPSNRESVLCAKICNLFKANARETAKEVVRPNAAHLYLWGLPKATTSVFALNRVHIVAPDAISVLRLSKTAWSVGRSDSQMNGWPGSVVPDRLLGSGCNNFDDCASFEVTT